jgi:hypothetical protein
MKKNSILAALVLALVAVVPAAKADLLWTFSYTDIADGISATGTLTTSSTLDSNLGGFGLTGFEITGISGERNGSAITGLISDPFFPAANTADGYIYDNGLLNAPAALDNDGFVFSAADGNLYNIFSVNSPSGGGYDESVNGSGSYNVVTLSITPDFQSSSIGQVPDTANTGLLLASVAGLALIVSTVRNRRMTAAQR